MPSRTLQVPVVGGVLDVSSASSSLSSGAVPVVPSIISVVISPLAHAIGGSIGTALAMLLLYPLERVRIELQIIQKQQQQQQHQQQLQTSISSSSNTIVKTKSTKQTKKKKSIDSCLVQQSQQQESCTSNDNSFSNTQQQQQQQHYQQTTTAGVPPTNNEKNINNNTPSISSNNKRFEFIQCIVRLWNEQTLYRGVNSVVLTMALSNFLFFYINEYLKKQFLTSTSSATNTAKQQQSQQQQSQNNVVFNKLFFQFYTKTILQQISTVDESIKVLLSLCIAGIINVVVTNPLWVTNLRIMTNDNNNKLDSSTSIKSNTFSFFYELVSIINNEGLVTLWSGTNASILLVSNPIIQFYTYYLLKKNCMPRTSTTSTGSTTTIMSSKSQLALLSFLFGGISKIIATILTYPLQLAQSLQRLESNVNTNAIDKQQQQTNNVNNDIDKNNVQNNNKRNIQQQLSKSTTTSTSTTTSKSKIHIIQYLYRIYTTNGIQGLYRGMDTKLIQTALTAALTFVTYEEIVLLIQQQINIISGVQ